MCNSEKELVHVGFSKGILLVKGRCGKENYLSHLLYSTLYTRKENKL